MQEQLRLAEIRANLSEKKLQVAGQLLRNHGITVPQWDPVRNLGQTSEFQPSADAEDLPAEDVSSIRNTLSVLRQNIVHNEGPLPSSAHLIHDDHSGLERPTEELVIDGMAYSNLDDQDSGYLGVPSGAAMLQSLMQEITGDNISHSHPHQRRLPVSPEPAEGWIPTPLWHSLEIGNIDVDGMIDAYFKGVHTSYPLVHEPTFRAQYTQVVARPDGSSWNALAYAMAAIGAFTCPDVPLSVHWRLVMAARSNVSMATLEAGNMTLVQYLILMANNIQKWNRLNSAFSYLGHAMHMAVGLGIHQGDRNRNRTLLDIEIRRRIWWSLYTLLSGAATTFG